MNAYSLTEYKLRRYIYLGHEYSIYVPPAMRTIYWPHRHQDDVTGVRIIGKIIKKNKAEEINSLVPIIIKMKKENKLLDERHLIFALAVCAKLESPEYEQVVKAAYDAVNVICTDGIKLLMFVAFCGRASNILHDEGINETVCFGFGNGFRKALHAWYLDRDPLLTTGQILRHRSYGGWSHKNIVQLSHIDSTDPSRKILLVYILYGMKKVEKLFGKKLKKQEADEEEIETSEDTQLRFVYDKMKMVSDIGQMDDVALSREIELRRWGHEHEVIPKIMLNNYKVLTSLTKHMPLPLLLEKTCLYAKNKLFRNTTPDTGLREFILRFNNSHDIKECRLHPIESYLQYVKYSRTCQRIITIQNNILKKRGTTESDIEREKLKVVLKKKYEKKDEAEPIDVNASNYFPIEVWNSDGNAGDKDDKNNEHDQINMVVTMSKPPPKLVYELATFLSEDLVDKTLKCLDHLDKKILIGYDCREGLDKKKCYYSNLLSMREAIILTILSLIYPGPVNSKPTIFALRKNGRVNDPVNIDYDKPLNVTDLEPVLFKSTGSRFSNFDISPLAAMKWAIRNKQEFDVFIFMGTNKMNFKNILSVLKDYKRFSSKPVRIIVMCLSGKHVEQRNLSRQHCLFIAGFDKNVGKIIHSFIQNEF